MFDNIEMDERNQLWMDSRCVPRSSEGDRKQFQCMFGNIVFGCLEILSTQLHVGHILSMGLEVVSLKIYIFLIKMPPNLEKLN